MAPQSRISEDSPNIRQKSKSYLLNKVAKSLRNQIAFFLLIKITMRTHTLDLPLVKSTLQIRFVKVLYRQIHYQYRPHNRFKLKKHLFRPSVTNLRTYQVLSHSFGGKVSRQNNSTVSAMSQKLCHQGQNQCTFSLNRLQVCTHIVVLQAARIIFNIN